MRRFFESGQMNAFAAGVASASALVALQSDVVTALLALLFALLNLSVALRRGREKS